MLIRRKRHSVPSLNTTSTADISFMLLTFFLVTSSMDVDRGLVRQLPPPDDEENASDEQTEVARENTMTFRIDAASRVTLDGRPVDMKRLRADIARFIDRRRQSHIIYVDADPVAGYDAYFQLENEIAAAYHQVRDAVARSRYHRQYAALTESQKAEVRGLCPQRIAETYNDGQRGAQAGAEGKGGAQ